VIWHLTKMIGIWLLATLLWSSLDLIVKPLWMRWWQRFRIALMVSLGIFVATIDVLDAYLKRGIRPSSVLILAGVTSNFLAIAMNNWKMPARVRQDDSMHRSFSPETRARLLCDVIGPFSIGDLALLLGFLFLVSQR
jgi:hypothetical protein